MSREILTSGNGTSAGPALLDEHLVQALQGYGYWPTSNEHYAVVLDGLERLAQAGVTTVLDTTTIECGRDAELLTEAARDSRLRLLCCTGLSAAAAGVGAAFRALPAVELADIFVSELTDHLPGSELRASAIILECTEQIEPFDETATLAACFAHAETAAPILVRAPSSAAVARVDRLVGRGVDPDRILVLGLDDASTTIKTLEALISRGVLMGITSIGDEDRLSLDARCAMLAFILRSAGPSRVALGTGSALCRSAPGQPPAEAGLPETALGRLRDRAPEFGIDQELLATALMGGAHALLAPVAVRSG